MAAFRIFLILFALVPLFFGVTGVFGGAQALTVDAGTAKGLPDGVLLLSHALDNQFRYLSGVYIGVSAMLFYCASGPCMADPRRALLYRGIVLAVFIGGCARVISYLSVGPPPTEMIIGMIAELGLPVTLLWQSALIGKERV